MLLLIVPLVLGFEVVLVVPACVVGVVVLVWPLAVVRVSGVELALEVFAGLLMSVPVDGVPVELMLVLLDQLPRTRTWRPTQVLKSCEPVNSIGWLERAVRRTVLPSC